MKKLTLFVTLAILTAGCSMHRKISSLRESSISADISLPSDQFIPSMSKGLESEKDTIEPEHPVEVLIMNAVKDENGEMVELGKWHRRYLKHLLYDRMVGNLPLKRQKQTGYVMA